MDYLLLWVIHCYPSLSRTMSYRVLWAIHCYSAMRYIPLFISIYVYSSLWVIISCYTILWTLYTIETYGQGGHFSWCSRPPMHLPTWYSYVPTWWATCQATDQDCQALLPRRPDMSGLMLLDVPLIVIAFRTFLECFMQPLARFMTSRTLLECSSHRPDPWGIYIAHL